MATVMALNSSLAARCAFGTKPAQKQQARTSQIAKAGPNYSPSSSKTPDSALEYAKTLPGISDPFPEIFDPANLLARADGSVRPVDEVKRWREAEITHGRVSMLAALGFVVGEQLEDFPAFLNVDGHITGPAINHFQQVEARGAIFWEPLLFAIALAEGYRVNVGWENPAGGSGFNTLYNDYAPGELGFDPLGLCPPDGSQEKYDMQTKELNNGRLAMIGIAGFVAQELVDGKVIFGSGVAADAVPGALINQS
jgi:light-harvesting complex I chlorophyll a/b binding protein 1